MTLGSIMGSLVAPSAALSSALTGGLAAFLGAGISGVSLAHFDAGALAADEGVRWGTLVGGAFAFVVGVGALGLLRTVDAPRALFLRTAAWTAFGVVLGPLSIGAGAWFGAAAGAGGADHFAHVLVAMPTTWPVAACSALLAAAMAALAYGQNGPA